VPHNGGFAKLNFGIQDEIYVRLDTAAIFVFSSTRRLDLIAGGTPPLLPLNSKVFIIKEL
jgi:hypothetical protein